MYDITMQQCLKNVVSTNDITTVWSTLLQKRLTKRDTNVKAKDFILELVFKNGVDFRDDEGSIKSENEKTIDH